VAWTAFSIALIPAFQFRYGHYPFARENDSATNPHLYICGWKPGRADCFISVLFRVSDLRLHFQPTRLRRRWHFLRCRWQSLAACVLPASIISTTIGVLLIRMCWSSSDPGCSDRFFLQGEQSFCCIQLNALTGALCIFLVWYFVKTTVGNSSYALLIASLFGASTTQLAFGSIIETYIFLSAVALIFLVLLLKDKPLFMLVITGLVAFGSPSRTWHRLSLPISSSSAISNSWLFTERLLVHWSFHWACWTMWSIQNHSHISGKFLPSKRRDHNSFPQPFSAPNFLGRVMFLAALFAPETVGHSGWIPFPKDMDVSGIFQKDPMYLLPMKRGLVHLLPLSIPGFGLLLFGRCTFPEKLLKQDNRYFFTFILTLLFNLRFTCNTKGCFPVCHNWTYAIVLFLALAWREYAEQRWFQIVCAGFHNAFTHQQLANTMDHVVHIRPICEMTTMSHLPSYLERGPKNWVPAFWMWHFRLYINKRFQTAA